MFGAAYAQGQGAAGSGGWLSLVPILLMILIFYFLLIRPQQKKEKQRQAMINNLQKGDKVVTAGGMHGVIVAVKDDIVTLKVASNTNIDFIKSSIQAKVS
ncbi:MAG TPA: preprotein translocase subunit YajC [Spirochaetota bacterium]|nr:preprotein translocase subunit YajC [Spirochaetota bacterium]HPF04704.1 preprotein translocase subunit YajC [Spirochaetota bacterium]HPJ41933.1 preprotein translocase subunit YajC [Spirochaetota bacterium]HPR38045.1 preprotein translocase subunit YajC [Spirochaetota bacterium]HRX48366.1 preprotein translocase subunit YajC [Spirochaetota bacterium]